MEKVDINQPTEMTTTEQKETPVVHDVIQDISIAGVTKQPFRINGRDDKIIELDISDLNIIPRLQKGYDDLVQIMEELKNTKLGDDDDSIQKALQKADAAMREKVDYIFDSNVSDVCCGNGTMYDPRGGKFRWELILENLLSLYHSNITKEYEKMKSRVGKYTDQYTAKRGKSATKPKRRN